MLYLFYPIIQRFFLSRYLRNVWDARGRVDCQIKSVLIFEEKEGFHHATIENISSGGVSLRFHGEEEQGSFLEKKGKILFHDPQGTPLSFDFLVKSQRPSHQTVSLGLEFIGLEPKEKIYLRSVLRDQFTLMSEKVTV